VSAPAPSAARDPAAPGLDLRFLALESRTSLLDYAARNIPGASLATDGRLRLAGGAPAAMILVDGFRLHRLALPIEAMDGARFELAGYGGVLADAPAGVIAVSTRPPTERTHAEVESFVEAPNPAAAAVIAPTAAGPLLPGRLYFMAGARLQATRAPGAVDPEGILPDAPDGEESDRTGALKLTWVPRPQHRLEALTLVENGAIENGGGINLDKPAQPTRRETALFTGLTWTGALGHGLVVRSQLGYEHGAGSFEPNLCRYHPDECDLATPRTNTYPRLFTSDNGTLRQARSEDRWQLTNTLEARLPGPAWLEQRLQASSVLQVSRFHWAEAVPSGKFVELNGLDTPTAQTEAFANDPRTGPAQLGWARFEGSTFTTTHALEDLVRLGERLWLTPGLGVVTSQAHTQEGMVLSALAFTAGLRAAWDATGDGRTWLRASAQSRVDPDLESAARFTLGSPTTRRCTWNPMTMSFDNNCVFSGGAGHQTVGLPCGPTGVSSDGRSCRSAPALPQTAEYTVGVGRALPAGLALDADFVYQRTSGLPSTAETNRIWNASGTALTGYRSGRAEAIYDWGTSPALFDRYLGATLALSKRTGALRATAAYTRFQLLGDRATLPGGAVPAAPANAWGDVPGRRAPWLATEDAHDAVRVQATWDIFGYASLGVIYGYDSGTRFQQTYRNDVTGSFDRYRTPTAVNPGTNLNDPSDDRTMRLPSIERLNAELRVHFKPLIRVDVDLFADVINFRDWGYVRKLDDYTLADAMPGHRWFRLGAVFRN
jgi:hypothetical protein